MFINLGTANASSSKEERDKQATNTILTSNIGVNTGHKSQRKILRAVNKLNTASTHNLAHSVPGKVLHTYSSFDLFNYVLSYAKSLELKDNNVINLTKFMSKNRGSCNVNTEIGNCDTAILILNSCSKKNETDKNLYENLIKELKEIKQKLI